MRAVTFRRWRVFALVMAILVVASACTAQIEVQIEVADDGSGTVTAGIGLDDAARVEVPALSELLVTSDLVAAGWTVGPPEILDDGREWIRVEKAFASADELQGVLDELFGADTVLRDFVIEREASNSTTRFALDGTVDLTEGLAVFTDPALVETLGVGPIGIDVEALAADQAIAPEDAVSASVVVDLPFGEAQRFEIPLGETLEIEAEATDENRVAQLLGWVRWALIALFLLSLVLVAINYLLDRRYAGMAPEQRPARLRSRVPGGTAQATAGAGSQQPRPQMQMMVLDVHEVLFRMSPDPLERVVPFVKAHGSPLSNDEIIELHRQATLGRMRSPAFWEACGVVGDAEQLDAELLAGIRLQHGAKEFLREMHRRGVPVAVVTNDLADWSHRLRDLHGLSGVTPWVVSSEIGVRKPDPAAYEALRRITGIPYFSMVVVDGQIPALDTARTLGTMTAWFARHKPPEGAEPGHAVITKFGDFFRRRASPEPAGAGRGASRRS
jgi:putative hydrolase of the HAD superfamily